MKDLHMYDGQKKVCNPFQFLFVRCFPASVGQGANKARKFGTKFYLYWNHLSIQKLLDNNNETAQYFHHRHDYFFVPDLVYMRLK